MLRDRVSDDLYLFSSTRYAQVTAGVVLSPEGAVLIDTLAFPDEAREIKDFIESKMGQPVLYVINTHYHADHTMGNYLFPDAEIVAHSRCRELMDTRGRRGLQAARAQTPELEQVSIALPTVTFGEGMLNLVLGKKTLQLFGSPGHSMDHISVLVKEDRILFAGDSMMPLPHIVDGDLTAMQNTLREIPHMGLENVVQGHGEIVLRGEIDDTIKSHLKYLTCIEKKAREALARGDRASLRQVDITECGKSKIALGGLVTELHTANLLSLYDKMAEAQAREAGVGAQ
ncbi:MAG: MBL fold metallo-hydrolase [Chloroflexi bacterium]|nr:MBL fold metallo-hydrolase [Chloroflexota bacterium]